MAEGLLGGILAIHGKDHRPCPPRSAAAAFARVTCSIGFLGRGAVLSNYKPTCAVHAYRIAMTEMNVKPIAGERSWEFEKIIRR
jgi:hypothetical protein